MFRAKSMNKLIDLFVHINNLLTAVFMKSKALMQAVSQYANFAESKLQGKKSLA